MMALMETFMGRFTGDLYFIFSEIREKTPVITVKIQKRSRGNIANVIRIIYRGTIYHCFGLSKTLIECKLKERFYCS